MREHGPRQGMLTSLISKKRMPCEQDNFDYMPCLHTDKKSFVVDILRCKFKK